ncbi:hypothetical protein PRIPAC_75934 [Pristionchus pacificus]|uniref:Uncharacterized protein n=1 Tax=Pristionchus pacificus TaxID=54126 RepID=A0A2A6C1C9_PRIPA|nr:hypothetical protein PRIPAC_75934 [Pristionchus pacificus]|eukprot:PDM71907.1 hypothetical protein PRIPAC_38314 [Pristionchus pacificus]
MFSDRASTERPSMDATPRPVGVSKAHKLSFNLCIGLIVFSFVLLIIGIASGVTAVRNPPVSNCIPQSYCNPTVLPVKAVQCPPNSIVMMP